MRAVVLLVLVLALGGGVHASHYPGFNEARGSCPSPRQKCTVTDADNATVCSPPADAFDKLQLFTASSPVPASPGFRRIESIPWTADIIAIPKTATTFHYARSTNGGSTWTTHNVSSTPGIVRTISVAVLTDLQRIFISVESNFTCGFWSFNASSWASSSCSSSNFTNKFWDAWVYVPVDQRLLFYRPTTSNNQHSVMISTDGALTWSTRNMVLGGNWRNACRSPYLNRILVVSSAGRMFTYSDDGGETHLNATYNAAAMSIIDYWDCAWVHDVRIFTVVASGEDAGNPAQNRFAHSYDGRCEARGKCCPAF